MRTAAFLTDSTVRAATRNRRWRRIASLAALAGSLLTRVGWIAAGRVSANDTLSPSLG
ncbi:MAG TPA: hypothetical protein VKE51_27915 [Vicinamibacterales bacterium]|nr:hypothetical protein [Vicinamibacterales bacterium]